jgi:hypothetical protein
MPPIDSTPNSDDSKTVTVDVTVEAIDASVEGNPVTDNGVDSSVVVSVPKTVNPKIVNPTTPSIYKVGLARKSPRIAIQPTVTGKRIRTPIELFSPDSSVSVARSTPRKPVRPAKKLKQSPEPSPKVFMHQKEKEFLQLRAKVVETPYDEDLCAKANQVERDFYKSLLTLSIHYNNRTKWKGWELGYAKVVCLSKIGLEYAKTSRKSY